MRIAIAGCPRAGKTTLGRKLAAELGCPVQSADDLIPLGWSEASAALALKLVQPGPYVIEGVAVIRALRKALALTTAKPCDRLLWMETPRQELEPGQRRMFDEDAKRLAAIESELRRRGVEIVREKPARAQRPAPAKPAAPAAKAEADDPGPMLIESIESERWGDFGGRGF